MEVKCIDNVQVDFRISLLIKVENSMGYTGDSTYKGQAEYRNMDFFCCHCIIMILEDKRRENDGKPSICLERDV